MDASAVVSALSHSGPARTALADDLVNVPHLVDSEVAHVVRRHAMLGRISAGEGWAALDTWQRLGVVRWSTHEHLGRIWDLRGNVSAYDATYIALAESLGCPLITTDARLANAPGIRCEVHVLPRSVTCSLTR